MSCIYLADEFGVCCKDNPHVIKDKPCTLFNHGCKDQLSIGDVEKMRDRLAKAQELIERWRKFSDYNGNHPYYLGMSADELEEALKGASE